MAYSAVFAPPLMLPFTPDNNFISCIYAYCSVFDDNGDQIVLDSAGTFFPYTPTQVQDGAPIDPQDPDGPKTGVTGIASTRH